MSFLSEIINKPAKKMRMNKTQCLSQSIPYPAYIHVSGDGKSVVVHEDGGAMRIHGVKDDFQDLIDSSSSRKSYTAQTKQLASLGVRNISFDGFTGIIIPEKEGNRCVIQAHAV